MHYFFSLLFTLSFCFSFLKAQEFAADPAPDQLKVATWNVEWFFDNNAADNQSKIAKEEMAPTPATWSWKRDAVAAVIAEMRPTVIALQEVEGRAVLFELIKRLKEAHKQTYRLAFVEGFDGATEQDVAILYQSGCIEYSRREQNNAMFKSDQFYSLSKHLFAKFEWEASGHTESVNLVTAHLRAREEAAKERIKQSKLLHYMLRKQIESNENIVLLGDMNFESREGTKMINDDGIEALTGRETPSKEDDLIDLHSRLPTNARRTHLVLEREFDRILVSKSMMEDSPQVKDWVFEKVEIFPKLVIRGKDDNADHWEKRYTKPIEQREPSDHLPMMATFILK